jgi:putative holliday junction resolvase
MPEDNITAIGFDFGSFWIGSAVGQTRTCTASPLEAIRANQFKPDWSHIEKLIKTWQPSRLVVGLPTTMNDQEHEMTRQARRFSRQLEGRFHIKTELVDERLTTREAWQIIEQQASKKHDKPTIDCIAAVLITETWLHHYKSQDEPGIRS